MKKHPHLPIYLDTCGNLYKEDKTLKNISQTDRYKMVRVGDKTFSVHRLVVETFIGEIPKNKCVNHKDGDKYNNSLSNLEVVTYSENVIHAYENNLAEGRKGEKHHNNILSKEDVLNIYKDIKSFKNNEEIAYKYNIKVRLVSLLRSGSRWKHLFKENFSEPIPSFKSNKYSVEQMCKIADLCDNKDLSNKEISNILGVEASMISRIRRRKVWNVFFKYRNKINQIYNK